MFISLHQVFVAACGIFVIREIQFPDRGSNSCPHCPSLATPTPTLATQSLPLDHQGSPSDFFDNSHIAINIYIQIFIFLGLCLRVELLSHVVTRYEELLDCFPKVTTVLHSHQQCVRVVICPYPHQHVLSVFMILIIQVVGNGVVLICISLMINDIENLFLCLLAICIISYLFCLSYRFSRSFLQFQRAFLLSPASPVRRPKSAS